MKSARFVFRLERLLSLRERHESDAAVAFATARARLERLQHTQTLLAAHREATSREANHAGGSAASIAERHALHVVADRADAALDYLESLLLDAQTEAESERDALARRTLDRRALERLRERQAERWRDETARIDRDAMDEIALQRAVSGAGRVR